MSQKKQSTVKTLRCKGEKCTCRLTLPKMYRGSRTRRERYLERRGWSYSRKNGPRCNACTLGIARPAKKRKKAIMQNAPTYQEQAKFNRLRIGMHA